MTQEEAERQEAPQEWEGGWIHSVCGGEAEKIKPPYYGGNCLKCGHTVPVEELVKT